MSSDTIRNMPKHLQTRKQVEIAERQEVVWQMIQEGYRYREIAELLNVSIGTVASDKRKSLERYQERTKERIDDWLAEQLMMIEEQSAIALRDMQVQELPVCDDEGEAIPGKWDISPNDVYRIRDKAARRLDDLMARKAKLVGLDVNRVQVDKRVAIAVLGSGMTIEDL